MRAWPPCLLTFLIAVSDRPVTLEVIASEIRSAEAGRADEPVSEATLEAEFRRTREALRASPEFKTDYA